MEKEEEEITTNKLKILAEMEMRVNSLVLPTESDSGIFYDDKLKDEKAKIINEMQAEAIKWSVGKFLMIFKDVEKTIKTLEKNKIGFTMFDMVDEKNFYYFKGLVKKAILDEERKDEEEESSGPSAPPIVRS